ncbi:MAG: sensor domain-containing diguanylate cyclase [Spirochaetia bacterium]|nr:sensor domain-containing diguanylate cyclase [Spirochaetia bacterium]
MDSGKIFIKSNKLDNQTKKASSQIITKTATKEAEAHLIGYKDLQEAYDRVALLNKIGQEITSSLDLGIVMNTIYKNISSFISADLFGIALYDKDSEEIDFKYFLDEGKKFSGGKKPVDIEGSMAGWVIQNKKHLFINDVQNEYSNYVPKLIGTKADGTNSLIFVPLIINNKVIGVITVQSFKLNAYTDQDLEIIQAVGAYSTIAIENSKVHEEIRELNNIISSEKKELEKAYLKIDKLANHDTLTGLANRRLFVELLKQEIRKADRQKSKTAVLFIDLDNFKPVNDSLGHSAGDKVLQMVAQRFISTLRESDSIARIGGDEFAAIICNIKNKTDIEKLAEKIINNLRNPFIINTSKFQIGISMGISIYPDDDITIDGLLRKADTAMYKIKSESKNSFLFYNEII